MAGSPKAPEGMIVTLPQEPTWLGRGPGSTPTPAPQVLLTRTACRRTWRSADGWVLRSPGRYTRTALFYLRGFTG